MGREIGPSAAAGANPLGADGIAGAGARYDRPTGEITMAECGDRRPRPGAGAVAGTGRAALGEYRGRYPGAPMAFARTSVSSRVSTSGGCASHPERLRNARSASAAIQSGCSLRQGITLNSLPPAPR